jgi:hypothetical protein
VVRCLARLQSTTAWAYGPAAAVPSTAKEDKGVRIMPGSSRSPIVIACSIALALAAPLAMGACADGSSSLEKASGPSGDRTTRDVREGLGGRNREEGSLFGPGGLFGSKSQKKDDTGTGVAVNAYLWRASLDTINFIPLVSADPFGGVIITDWYTPSETPNERMKVQVTILDRDLRADGVRVAVFKQQTSPRGGNWVDAQVDPRTNIDIENAILTRARQLRIAGGS